MHYIDGVSLPSHLASFKCYIAIFVHACVDGDVSIVFELPCI